MHHVGVVLAGEDIAGPSHVGGELINFVKAPIDHVFHKVLVAKIADDKIIRLGLAEARELEVGAAHPEAFSLQTPHEMMTDEAAGPAHEGNHSRRVFRHVISPKFATLPQPG